MPAGQATTKPIEVTYFSITAPTDMIEALTAAEGLQMRGTIRLQKDRAGEYEWVMEVIDLQDTAVEAKIGDVFIWDTIKLISISQAEFETRYTVYTVI